MRQKRPAAPPPITSDGRYIVVRGRLWRRANPDLREDVRNALVQRLMDARRAVAKAKRSGDLTAEDEAHAAVNEAKVALGERGPPWWHDGAPDLNRHLARNTHYAAWFADAENADTVIRPAVGVAGWSIPRAVADAFPAEGTHLERYARILPVVEINSSFYKPHRRATYERWAASTPVEFRFAAKLPKAITHECRLLDADRLLDTFIGQIGGLGHKLRVVLAQLPPSLSFDVATATRFFQSLRDRLPSGCHPVCEPRHASWFCAAADGVLSNLHVPRAGADPAVTTGAGDPGGWMAFRYRRLHGSPKIYYSPYGPERLAKIAEAIEDEYQTGIESWCIFDNTASGAAAADALELQSELAGMWRIGTSL